MIIAEFTVIPMGTGSTSVSDYIAEVCKEIKNSGLRYMVTPMGTIIESENLDEIFNVIKKAHEVMVKMGVKRIVTTIKIDDRRDKERKMEDKVEVLKQKGVI
ncbi:MAG: thiamine-binding protein [Candidatus Methanomethylicota archaeon]|jgi:uncharacterized protein (TIGR00106 family)|uniref:Thiamine-binding protein n=1 Tax=Thermoproteota archaeon TaxID=2056631 RepID=A0A520KEF5_9CREN|nr:MAG: MTH1187 family thiamine-binding protein [Candidatus Verstraetearchaeota archaeon]TDA38851.1 MAG: thiamine-binding protein [Candidatus Verstraetearchaeota archaeon]